MADGSPRGALVRQQPPAPGLPGLNSGGVVGSRHTAHGSSLQMIRAHAGPVFPRGLACWCFDTRRLVAIVGRAVPLPAIFRALHLSPLDDAFRGDETVGWWRGALGTPYSFVPVPLSNIPPAIVISLVAFTYLEEDGALLGLALIAAFVLLVVVISGTIWGLTTL